MPMDIIDLHTHSTASDGTFRPKELVAAAQKAGLQAVALTDHDTIAGLSEAVRAGQDLGMEVVPGVELAIEAGLKGGLHLLGLWVDHQNSELKQGLEELQAARKRRNPRMVERLNQMGIDLTIEEVRAMSGGGQVGRPHFAKALVNKGLVGDINEAFARYLAAGKPAYIPKDKFDPQRALALVRGAGGLPVLAHPGMHGLAFPRMEEIIKSMMPLGLEGVEAHYTEHDPTLSQRLVKLAGRLGLVISGGSDFHGANKPKIKLGVGKGTLRVPASLLASLKTRRDQVRAAQG